jgi:hypothetical protein
MGIREQVKIKDKVANYLYAYQELKATGTRVYIDMEKVNNLHIFNEKYAIFHSFTEYRNVSGKVLFNVHVSPLSDRFATLSILVRVSKENVDDILTSLSTSIPVKKDS